MPNLSDTICTIIGSYDLSAYSLSCGYGLTRDGKTVRWPVGALLFEKRNDKGRVTCALLAYADGSRIEFTYAENRGSKLKSIPFNVKK